MDDMPVKVVVDGDVYSENVTVEEAVMIAETLLRIRDCKVLICPME